MRRLLRFQAAFPANSAVAGSRARRVVLALVTSAAGIFFDFDAVQRWDLGLTRPAEARRMRRFEDNDRSDNNSRDDRGSSSNNSSNNSDNGSSSSNSGNSDSGRGNSSSNSQTGKGGGSSNSDDGRGNVDNSQPPRTLLEGLQRLSKESDKSEAAKPRSHRKGRAKKGDDADDDTPSAPLFGSKPPAATASKTGPRPSLPGSEPWNGDLNGKPFASGEVLAKKRLNPAAVEQVTGLGFAVSPPGASGLARVRVPHGMGALEAEKILNDLVPGRPFATNKLYRFFGPSNGASIQAHGVVDVGTAARCSGDRCIGRRLLNWDDRELSACTADVRVGIIDTGIDIRHPSLRTVSSGVFLPNGRTAAPDWHGTGVLALLAGDPKSGTPGLIPNASFFAAGTFFVDGRGEYATDTVALMDALDWLRANKVKIVNMSFAGPRDEVLEREIARLSKEGMVFVAAAGNEGPTAEPSFPAAYAQVIAVTAVSKERRVYTFANRGRYIDVAAPGVDIWTAVPGGREGFYTGTSFAAPFATALVATVYAHTPDQRKDKLLGRVKYQDLGLPGPDSTYGRGLPVAPSSCVPSTLVADEPAPPTVPASTTTGSVTPPNNWRATVSPQPSSGPRAKAMGFQ